MDRSRGGCDDDILESLKAFETDDPPIAEPSEEGTYDEDKPVRDLPDTEAVCSALVQRVSVARLGGPAPACSHPKRVIKTRWTTTAPRKRNDLRDPAWAQLGHLPRGTDSRPVRSSRWQAARSRQVACGMPKPTISSH